MLNPYSVIKGPYVTEKSDRDRKDQNKYTFLVDVNANKCEIKEAVQKLFNVKVLAVNVVKLHGKKRMLRFRAGERPDRKKAIVKVAKEQAINIYNVAE
ncbi:50S ribosomal protein L23 [Candidatus Poribacteria bacterium]|nr:50S ribosomal protein L23 [Candidatus Poribacteria bacterium]